MIDRERLRLEMEKQGVTQAQLARAAQVSPASIQQILNGSVKTPRSTRRLADALQVSTDWLEGVSDDPGRRYLEDIVKDDFEPMSFQYFNSAPPKRDNHVDSRVIIFGKSWIEKIDPEASYETLVVVRISTTEMIPTIMPGDDIIVKGQDYDADPDGIWTFNLDGKSYLRRVRRSADGHVTILTDNPHMRAFDAVEADIRFVGKVIWQGRKLIP